LGEHTALESRLLSARALSFLRANASAVVSSAAGHLDGVDVEGRWTQVMDCKLILVGLVSRG
jgi:hypothetical protein